MWHPKKAAFRAGNTTGTEWNDTNIGAVSTAFGNNTKANGGYSFAAGAGTTASGLYSTALGFSTVATGDSSVSMGYGTSANGPNSVAMGYQIYNEASNTLAIGYSATPNGSPDIMLDPVNYCYFSGDISGVSIGTRNVPNAKLRVVTSSGGAAAIGSSETVATGNYAVAIGSGTTASGICSTTMGYGTTASGLSSVAIGMNISNSTTYSLAVGYNVSVGGLPDILLNPTGTSYFSNDSGTGNVGIGTREPETKLQVLGGVKVGKSGANGSLDVWGPVYFRTLSGSGGLYTMQYNNSTNQVSYTTSSRRYKDNIKPFVTDFNNILNAEPKSFVYKAYPDTQDIGFIAEELDGLGLKELVIYDKSGRPDSVKYEKVPLYLLQVIKEQRNELQEVKSRLKALEEKFSR